MCGIAGVIAEDANPSLAVQVDRMAGTLRRRGPDGGAVLELGRATFGHRRLAIVDLEGGVQPMASVDDGVVMVANAEIYNHLELRRRLEGLGYAFRTQCDVEVILHGYRAWGADVVGELAGMFAFALWDERRGSLLLARDRFGQKPVYYAAMGRGWAFASEPKALLAGHGGVPRLNRAALARYLALDHIPAPWCIFEGIQKLQAGHIAELRIGGAPRVRRYWTLPFATPRRVDESQMGDELREKFRRAVSRRLMSDVPVGLLLSGGLDSTVVGAELKRQGVSLASFSLGFDEPEFDESAAARSAARWLGTKHYELRMRARDMIDELPSVLEWLDEPFADPSLLAVSALSRMTSEHVKVALGGDGADEQFGGYDVFLAARLDALTRWLGPMRAAALRGAARLLGARDEHFSWDFRCRQFARGLGFDELARPIAYTLGMDEPDLWELLGAERDEDVLTEVRQAAGGAGDPVEATLRAYSGLFLESDILFKTDRAGMAHGLEIRAPFLDHELAEAVARIPARVRVRWRSRKWLVREVLGEGIPAEIVGRPKQGFSLPIVRWINGELRGWFDDVLLDEHGYRDGVLRRQAVERLLRRHRRGEANLRKPIWNLAMLLQWKSRWCSAV